MDFKKSKSKGKEGALIDKTGVSGFMWDRVNDLFDLLMMPVNSRQSEGNIGANVELGSRVEQPSKSSHPLSPNRDRPLMPIDPVLMKEIMFNKLFYAEDPRQNMPEEPDLLRQPDFFEEMRKLRRHSTIYDRK